MSVRRQRRRRCEPSGTAYTESMLRPLVGRRVAGGCYACVSFQEVEPADPPAAGVFRLLTFHAPGCPFGVPTGEKSEDELVAEVAAFVHRARVEGVA